MYRTSLHTIILSIFFFCLLAGCTTQAAGPTQAIEGYLNAMVAKDGTKAASLACSVWEAQAQTEAESFSGVTAQLQDMACQVTGKDGSTTLVSCTGKIVTSYNGENSELDLTGRTYKVVQEDGEWRMCGYQ